MTEPRKVAALYVDPNGPYFGREGVDPWDETRDAKKYDGPDPVVAHPPCGPWGKLKGLCTKQDPMCAVVAVSQVRRFGGVLEHPAHSSLWRYMGLPAPGCFDAWGLCIEVNQVSWGHQAKKKTWLYCVRVDLEIAISGFRSGGVPTHVVSTSLRIGAKLPKQHSAMQRRTPPAFADYLISLARSVK